MAFSPSSPQESITPPPLEQPTLLRHWLLLLALLAAALGLRCFDLGSDSLWHDELWGMEMAVGHDATQLALPASGVLNRPPDLLSLDPATPWQAVWTHMHGDTHPPIYHLCLRFWEERFGTSERAVRSLALIWSVLAIVFLFDAVRIHNGPRAALWAAALMAVASPQIQYGQEIRSYALLLLEGMVALDALVRIQRRGGSILSAIVLGIAVLAMALTHYFAAGAIAAISIYAVLKLRRRGMQQTLVAVSVAGLVGLAIWGKQFNIQRANFSNNPLVDWLLDPSRHPLAMVAARLVLLPSRFLFDSSGWLKPVSAVLVLLLILPPMARRRYPQLMLWWLWMVGTIAPVAIIDALQHTMHLAYIRYVLLAAPAAYVLLATAEQWLPTGRWGRIVPATALLVTVLAIPFRAYHPSWRPNWRGIAQTIDANRQPGEPVCCVGPCADGFWGPDGIYIEMNYYLRPLSGPIVLITDPSPKNEPAAAELLHGQRQIWAIVAGSGQDTQWPPPDWVIESSKKYLQIGTLEHLRHDGSTVPTP